MLWAPFPKLYVMGNTFGYWMLDTGWQRNTMSYKKIAIWQVAQELVVEIHKTTFVNSDPKWPVSGMLITRSRVLGMR